MPLGELYKFIISGDKGLPCKPTKTVEIMLDSNGPPPILHHTSLGLTQEPVSSSNLIPSCSNIYKKID